MARPKKIPEESQEIEISEEESVEQLEVSEPELAPVDSPVEPCECEECTLKPGQYIREVNGIKYLAYKDVNGVTFDIKKL